MNEVQTTKTMQRNKIFGTKTNEEVIIIGLVGISFAIWLMISIFTLGMIQGLIVSVIVGVIHLFAFGKLKAIDTHYGMPYFLVIWNRIKSSRKKKVYFYDYKINNEGNIKLPTMSKQVKEEIEQIEGGKNE